MGNKFDALGSLNDEGADKPTQGNGARDNNIGNNIGSTKKWVEEFFNGKQMIGGELQQLKSGE